MQPIVASNRNAACPCGSGRRYKACCGRLPSGQAGVEATLAQTMHAALAQQRAGRLDEAANMYLQALGQSPDLPDAVHMLGVIRLQKLQYAEATPLLMRAADLTDWQLEPVLHNLGLALAAQLSTADLAHAIALWTRYETWRTTPGEAPVIHDPRITVLVPSFNHARFVGAALESVYAQTWRNVELIVIDDGSADGSPAIIADKLAASPFPARCIARANCGAARTLEQGLALATGDFVNVLNSDDTFTPERLQRMVDAVARRGHRWGFARVSCVDADDRPIAAGADPVVDAVLAAVDALPVRDTTGLALLTANAAVTTGNLFVQAELARHLGFRDFRYNHDWDFALRAALVSEPVYVPETLYQYRRHALNTIADSRSGARHEAHALLRDIYRRAMDGGPFANPFAPSPAVWRRRFWQQALTSWHGIVVPVEVLRDLAHRIQAEMLPQGAGEAA